MSKARGSREPSKPLGIISTDKIYTIDAFCRTVGLDLRTVRDMRKNGLKSKLTGKLKIMIRGADFDEYLATHAPDAEIQG